MYHRELLRWGLEEADRDMAIAMNGLTAAERRHQPGPESNHIDFIVWHVARVEDMWIQMFAQGKPPIWESGGWSEKLGIPTKEIGFGFTIEQARDLPVYDYDLMDEYAKEVRASTLAYIDTATVEELSKPRKTPNPNWDPFCMGFALARIQVELNQHIGNIAYIRGLQRGINQ